MNITKDVTIGEIVKDNFRAAKIFEHFGLDYCCGGNKRLEEVCSDKGVSTKDLLTELRSLEGIEVLEDVEFKRWEIENLIGYIVGHHHLYVKTSLPGITQHLVIIMEKHDKKHVQLRDVHKLFTKLGDELLLHMMREEKIVFPYIRKLSESIRNNSKLRLPIMGSFESVRIPVEAMEREHENAGGLVREIRMLCNDYTTPEDACQTFSITYEELKRFEENLHMHIHLENNILFPKAIKVEEELKTFGLKN
jgi:regulator of cell morphogenesis and NO signaling